MNSCAQAMMVPDYGMAPSWWRQICPTCPICPALPGLIGEISFYAFGFEKGRHLAKKMVLCLVLRMLRMLRMLCGVGW